MANANLNGVPPSDPQGFRALHGKRIIGVHAWMQELESDCNLLSFLVSSVPVDKLFSTIFEAEQL